MAIRPSHVSGQLIRSLGLQDAHSLLPRPACAVRQYGYACMTALECRCHAFPLPLEPTLNNYEMPHGAVLCARRSETLSSSLSCPVVCGTSRRVSGARDHR